MRRWVTLAVVVFALLGGACDFAPICPPNTQYDNGIRRCRVLDAGPELPPPTDSGIDAQAGEDAGGGDDDAGTIDDAGTADDAGGDDDAGLTSDDAGAVDDGGADGG